MVNCKIARLHAGAVVALSERNQRADLLYRKTEFPALPDKGQTPFVFLSITALAAVTARRSRQPADLLVVPDCGWIGPGATGRSEERRVGKEGVGTCRSRCGRTQ